MKKSAAKKPPIRGDVAKPEATRDPIFLLQSRQEIWTEGALPDGWDWSDDHCKDETGELVHTEGKNLDARLVSNGNVVLAWRVESVFFTREEAESWAQERDYRWAFWRVYCTTAEGALATLLACHSESPTGLLVNGKMPEPEEPEKVKDFRAAAERLAYKTESGRQEVIQPSRLEQDINNHDKHYRSLIQTLRLGGQNAHDLGRLLGEGSTVAHAIWDRYGGNEGEVEPLHPCKNPDCNAILVTYAAHCHGCGWETQIDW